MSTPDIDPAVEEILRDEIDDDQLRWLVQDILEWENEKLHNTRRRNKKDVLDEKITEYIKDQ